MNKEEALGDFFQGLHTVINNAFAYVKDHPYFLKSVEEFKAKLDQLFLYLAPLKITINPASLFVDGRSWEKVRLYEELAQIFHLRKIKSIEFSPGVSVQELTVFFGKLSLPTKEILKGGGLANILEAQAGPHILTEELDYSDLLLYAGEESSAAWISLLKEAVEKGDLSKAKEVAENFGRIMEGLKLKDFTGEGEFREALLGFLDFLQAGLKEEFYRCVYALFKFFLRHKDIPDADLEEVRRLFRGFQEEDFALLLWKKISEDEGFDIRAFKFFCRLSTEEKGEKIAFCLQQLSKKMALKDNTRFIGKAHDLLSGFTKENIPQVYRAALEGLLGDLSTHDLPFDRDALEENYRRGLLNLFQQEADRAGFNLILEPLLRECNQAIAEKNFGYLRSVLEILYAKIKADRAAEDIFGGLERRVTNFIEGAAFKEEPDSCLEQLFGFLRKSFLGLDFYLDMIFNQERFNPEVLKLFLRFFPADLPLFYERLEKKHAGIEFLAKVVEGLIRVNSAFSLQVIKHIFYFVGEVIRIEILRSMRKLGYLDEELVFSLLDKGGLPLKREALACLGNNAALRKKAAEKLLSLSSPWGKYNNILLENMLLVEESDLRDAGDYLAALAKRRFFWNSKLRAKASGILRGWNVRKD